MSKFSIKTYEFTAFAEADLLKSGDGSLGKGDSFTMPDGASVCISVQDDDKYLSGYRNKNENADDKYFQNAKITDGYGAEIGNG